MNGNGYPTIRTFHRFLTLTTALLALLPALNHAAGTVDRTPDGSITAIVTSPNFPGDPTLFIGAMAGGIYRSTDGGLSWQMWSRGLWNLNITALAISPLWGVEQTLFATTYGGIFRSMDGGASWQEVTTPFGSLNARDVALSPDWQNDRTLFVATADEGLLVSRDGGENWQRPRNGPTSIDMRVVEFSPTYGSEGLAWAGSGEGGLFVSLDRGVSWQAVSGLPAERVYTILVSPLFASDRTIVAALSSGLYKSSDGGRTWQRSLALDRPEAVSLAARQIQGRLLFMAGITHQDGTGELLGSRNRGTQWYPAANWNPLWKPSSLAPLQGNDTALEMLVGGRRAVMRSADLGATWEPLFLLDTTRYVRDLRRRPGTTSDQVVMATYGAGVLLSEDDGVSWRPINRGLTNAFVNGVAISPSFDTDGTLFAVTLSRIFRSTNGGASWQTMLNDPQGRSVIDIDISPDYANDGTVCAVIRGAGLYCSDDRGVTWSPRNNGLTDLFHKTIAFSPDFATDRTLFLGGDGILRSTDGGLSWQQMVLTPHTVYSLTFSDRFGIDGTLFGGAMTEGVLASHDGGTTWQQANSGLTFPWLKAISVSPLFSANGVVLAGSWGDGPYISHDGANLWHSWGEGLDNPYVRTLLFTGSADRGIRILAGTWGGLYHRGEADTAWQPVPFPRQLDVPTVTMETTGTWEVQTHPLAVGGTVLASNSPGSRIELPFQAGRVSVEGIRGPGLGIAGIYLDGTLVATVDCYNATRTDTQILYSMPVDSNSSHNIAVEVSGRRNPASGGITIALDAFTLDGPPAVAVRPTGPGTPSATE